MRCTFAEAGDRFELTFERQLDHPPEKVWRVLTEHDLMRQWFPCEIHGDWQVGAKLQFVFLHGEGEGLSEEEMRGEVLAVEPNELLEFSWGRYHYRCELAQEGEGCLLRFTESQTNPSEGARNAAGWEMCFDNLDAILQGVEIAVFAFEVWRGKFDKYSKQFEPEMGPQEGPPENYPT